jgi:hypothetical protein
MKLELKHLAAYLPYDLKGKYKLQDVDENYPEEIRDKLLTSSNLDFFIEYCKPILRPLSDLTKEITIKGEKFVPIEYIENNSHVGFDCNKMLLQLNENHNWIYHFDYYIVMYLIEWHFDIYGLIDEGLAIDINTL